MGSTNVALPLILNDTPKHEHFLIECSDFVKFLKINLRIIPEPIPKVILC